jgi:hypothetical protein
VCRTRQQIAGLHDERSPQESLDRDARDFPVNESAGWLLKALAKDPCPILKNTHELDEHLKGRFQPSPEVPTEVSQSPEKAEAVVEFIIDHAGHAQLP